MNANMGTTPAGANVTADPEQAEIDALLSGYNLAGQDGEQADREQINNYLGKYRLRVQGIKVFKSSDPTKNGATYIKVDYVVLQSEGEHALKAGAECCWLRNMGGPFQATFIRRHLAAITGFPANEVEIKRLGQLCHTRGNTMPGGICAALGVEVNCRVFNKAKKNKEIFPADAWSVAPGFTLRELMAKNNAKQSAAVS